MFYFSLFFYKYFEFHCMRHNESKLFFFINNFSNADIDCCVYNISYKSYLFQYALKKTIFL